MKNEHHAEFSQFRDKLAAMGARKRQSVARESLHSMERSLSQFVPAEEVQKLGSLLGTGCSLSPWFSGHFFRWSWSQLIDAGGSTFHSGVVAAGRPELVWTIEPGVL
jgi:hypothetical protein